MKHWRLISWASLTVFTLIGCSQSPQKSPTVKVPATVSVIDPWVLEWTDPTNDTPAYLSNGRVGVRIGRDGRVLRGDGFRRAVLSAGIDPMPYTFPQADEWSIGGTKLIPADGTEYKQSLNLTTGILETTWHQEINGIRIIIATKASFADDLSVSWSFISDKDATMYGDGPFSEASIHSLIADEELTIGSLNDDWAGHVVRTVLHSIEIDGPPEDQRAVGSMMFYLRQSMGSEVPPGPMGLSNDTYNGHIFWDSDVWMFPALAFVDPDKAGSINRFRTEHFEQALHDGSWAIVDHKRVDWGDRAPARYPWESGIDGNEKTEGPTANGDHQSGGVAWSLDMASALGLVSKTDAVSVGTAVANYYKLRLSTRDGHSEIRDVTGVDEWFEGDNCLYTNAIADWTIKKYLGEDVNMYYPRDAEGLLAHDGDEREFYKQASAPLILWPLEREDLVDDPIAFLDMFDGKEAPNGPAMSLSVYALIRARYGDADQAYDTWRESWKKYTDGNPLMLFSEKPNQPDRTYFLTGAAGCINAVIYGFIGIRIVDEEPEENAKIKLENGKWLVIRPNLPAKWNSVTFHSMQVLGKSYDVHCEGRTATITPSN